MRQFYRAFPIRYAPRSELSWTHYQQIMRLDLSEARALYVGEAVVSNWGVRELKRQIDTHLYERLLHTQEAELLDGATDAERALTVLRDLGGIKDAETGLAMSSFKDSYVFEFADIPRNHHMLETDLETVLIDSLEEFLLELGRGFSFVKRQRHRDWRTRRHREGDELAYSLATGRTSPSQAP